MMPSMPNKYMPTHQASIFFIDHRLSHERNIHKIIRYLKETKDKGVILKIDRKKDVECYIDEDFANGYDMVDSRNPGALLSKTSYAIIYSIISAL